MKIKTTPDGKHAILRNGVPLYVMDDGTEREIDGAAAWKLALAKHFETSPVMAGLKIPADVAASFFGDSFRIEGGKLVAVDKLGIQLYSQTRHGDIATFDDAFAQLVDRYEGKGMIQREPSTTKPGATPTTGQQPVGSTITRAQFDSLPQNSRAKFFSEGGRISDAVSSSAPASASQPTVGKTMKRAEFDTANPQQLAVFFKSGGKVVD